MDLEELPLFTGLTNYHVGLAMPRFREVEVDFGTRIIEEGETDSTLLCVLEGNLEIRTGDTVLAHATPGDLVGEMALFGEGQRMASVEAASPARLLLLDRQGYERLRESENPVARQLEIYALEQLMQRLSDTSDAIAELSEGTPVRSVTPAQGFFATVRRLFGAGGTQEAPALDPVAILRKIPFFVDAPREALEEVGARTAGASYGAGSFLCTEGTIGQEMYLLAEGLVEVIISTEGDRVERLATLEPGDAFGMIALLDSRPRMASVVTRSSVTALVLGLEAWQDLVAAETPGGSAMRVAMIRCLSDQLAFANAQLTQLDLVRQVRAGGSLLPLLMASAGLEAYSKALTPRVLPERSRDA